MVNLNGRAHGSKYHLNKTPSQNPSNWDRMSNLVHK